MRNDNDEMEEDGADNLTTGDQETIQEFYNKLNKKNNTIQQQNVMTTSNLEEDADVGYNIMRSKSNPSKIILKKNDDLEFEKKKKLVGIQTFNVITDIINKINGASNVMTKLKILNNHITLYNLNEFQIEFISTKTNVILENDPKSLEDLHTKVCESEVLKKFFSLALKTRKEWYVTKALILQEYLTISVNQNDNIILDKEFGKYFRFENNIKKSAWNEIVGFNLDDTTLKIYDKFIVYDPSKTSSTSSISGIMKSARSFLPDYDWGITKHLSEHWGKYLMGGAALAAMTASVALIGTGPIIAMTAKAFPYGGDGAKDDDGNLILAGKIVGKDDTYGGHYMLLLQYIDQIINSCAKKHQTEHKWKWIVDNDDFVPYDECEEIARKTKECAVKLEDKKRADKIRLKESAEALKKMRDELGEDVPPEDGTKAEYKRSRKHLKKQLKEGHITKATYKSLKKSAKKLLKK